MEENANSTPRGLELESERARIPTTTKHAAAALAKQIKTCDSATERLTPLKSL